MSDHSWLPGLLPWDGDEDGNPTPDYLDLIYSAYTRDFSGALPTFQGLLVHPLREPLHNGKCRTFWHVTSQAIRGARVVQPRRCERIRWIRPMIEASSDQTRVFAYPVEHDKGEIRWEIALTNFSYIVVLATRAGHFLLWTAFEQERPHRRRKAEKKFEAWVAAGGDFDEWIRRQKS